MSRIYNAVVFYGVKIQTKAAGNKDVSALFSGSHPLTAKAAQADLDIYCRPMINYLQFEKDDAFVIIGKRLANADVDHPLAEFDESSSTPETLKTIADNLSKAGYTSKPQFHLVCDHSD